MRLINKAPTAPKSELSKTLKITRSDTQLYKIKKEREFTKKEKNDLKLSAANIKADRKKKTFTVIPKLYFKYGTEKNNENHSVHKRK